MIRYNNHKDYKYYINKWKRGDFVSFKSVIKRLKRNNIINNNEYADWDVHREIRNCLVHNNAVPSKNFKYEVNGKKINFIKDQPFYGKLDVFIILVNDLARLYYHLVEKFHKKYF